MRRLLVAIIEGRIGHRAARVALALMLHGPCGARRLAALTGIDAAHCRRAAAELRAAGLAAEPVDNPPGVWAEKAHTEGLPCGPKKPTPEGGVGRKSPRENPRVWAEKAHTPAPGVGRKSPHPAQLSTGCDTQVIDFSRCGPKEPTPPCSSSGSSKENTTTTTSTPDAPRARELAHPPGFLAEQRAAAERLLAEVPEHAQALLDELAGLMAAGQPIRNPLAYLRGLVRRCQAGEFVPELGPAVADARRRAQAVRRVIEAAGVPVNQPRDRHEDHVTPPPPEIRARIEQIRREARRPAAAAR